MQTYTLDRETAAQQSRELGLKLVTPKAPELDAGALRFGPEVPTAQLLTAARESAKQISDDLRAQGLSSKDIQVLVATDSRNRSALEDALREQGLKTVYLERGPDAFGVESSYLRPAQNMPAASRAMVDPAEVKVAVDLASLGVTVKEKEAALHSLGQAAPVSEVKARVEDYVQSIGSEIARQSAPRDGVAVVMPDSLPASLTTLVESRLQGQGLMPLHAAERHADTSLDVSSLRTSANVPSGAEQRGIDAIRKEIGPDSKSYSDALIRDVIGGSTLQRLGTFSGKDLAQAASPLADQFAQPLHDANIGEIASATNEKYRSDSYESKYEFPNGVPKDCTNGIWLGNRSNVVISWGGTSANMARGIDRVQDFLAAKGFDATKEDIVAAFDRKTLEHLGKEGFDPKNFDVTHSALTAMAQEVGAGKPTGLDTLFALQRLETPGVRPDVAIVSDGQFLGHLNHVREKVAELSQTRTASSENRPHSVASSVEPTKAADARTLREPANSNDLRRSEGVERSSESSQTPRASAWEAAFYRSKTGVPEGSEGKTDGASQERTSQPAARDASSRVLPEGAREDGGSAASQQRESSREQRELTLER